MEYLTIVEYRAKYKKSPYTIRNGIHGGRFKDVKKIGERWFIADEPPIDRRVKTERFRNWRKK